MGEGLQRQTIPVRQGEDFDHEAVRQYLLAHVEGVPDEPMEVEQFPSGASNLTYLLRCGDWEGVMRRPPFGPLPPKAHDMKRESEILKRLHPVFPLVPEPYLFCEDTSIIGAPFYVMSRKKGIVLDDRFPAGLEPTEENCKRVSYAVVDTLVRLHDVNYKEAGLAEFGHPEGFLERQVNGWIARYERSKTEEIPQFEKLAKWMRGSIPVSREATIIHNDYKLNNMLLTPDLFQVAAILDWEMATIADPLFDLGVALGYWVQHDDPDLLKNGLPTVTVIPGFINRREFIERYAGKSGRDVSSLHFYTTFAYFKLAIVLQQIHYRWKTRQTRDERFATFNEMVKNLMIYAEYQSEHPF
jgi:aminoglycoside phosphotransferase (APT) family kinase protein